MAESRPKACIHLPLAKDLAERVEAACEARHLRFGAPREELLAALADVEGLLISNQVYVDESVYDAGPRLRVVSGFGVGYDRFDIDGATRRGIAICNTPDVVTVPVADMTIGLIIALSRRLFQNEAYSRSGGWARREPPPAAGFDLAGKTLGVVGFGRIGKEVTRRVQPFGVRVVFNDLFEEPPADAPRIPYRPLDALLGEADIVTLHVDLNPTSYHLIGARELGLMKPTAYLINTSRGPIVDEAALIHALREKRIRAAGLDVFDQEPLPANHPLRGLGNVVLTPHLGYVTEESYREFYRIVVEAIIAWRAGNPINLYDPAMRSE